jgi:hypothetical protein
MDARFSLPAGMTDVDKEISGLVSAMLTALCQEKEQWASQLIDEIVKTSPRQGVTFLAGMALGLLANLAEMLEMPVEDLMAIMALRSSRIVNDMDPDAE